MPDKPTVEVTDDAEIAIVARGERVVIAPAEVKHLMKQIALALAEATIAQRQRPE